jgi:heme-degrading monooxygenase HmoA
VFARISTIQGRADNIDDAIAEYRSALSQISEVAGNKGAFLLVDRGSGKAVGATLWDSEQSMTDSREQANRARQQAADESGGEVQAVEEYEVAVWETAA